MKETEYCKKFRTVVGERLRCGVFVSDNSNLSELRDKTSPRPTPDLSSHAEVSPASAHLLHLLLPVACQEEDGEEEGEGWMVVMVYWYVYQELQYLTPVRPCLGRCSRALHQLALPPFSGQQSPPRLAPPAGSDYINCCLKYQPGQDHTRTVSSDRDLHDDVQACRLEPGIS